MIKKFILFLCFLCIFSYNSYSQSREDIKIFLVPPIPSPNHLHSNFFLEYFAQEIAGAGYTLTTVGSEADFAFLFSVEDFIVHYDDGTSEIGDGIEDPRYSLVLRLIRLEDDHEMIRLSRFFTEMEEAWGWGLELIYSAVANIPLTRLGDIPIIDMSDYWRNKWLYIRISLGGGILINNANSGLFREANNERIQVTPPLHGLFFLPSFHLGLELQYLHWMNSELSVFLNFSEEGVKSGIGLSVGFPIKPGIHFKIVPYGIITAEMKTADTFVKFPPASLGGGIQFGVRANNNGAIVTDFRVTQRLGEVVHRHGNSNLTPPEYSFSQMNVTISIGYKFGFVDRPIRER